MPIIKTIQTDARLVIGGAGSQAAALDQQIARLGLEREARLAGRIARADVPVFLQTLRVFAMPSRAESFGVAALEAQACGLPVVATRVGGLPEVVAENQTGLFVPPDDPDALALALLQLLDDPDRALALGRAGREWVRERYDWQGNVSQMIALYERVAGAARSRS